MMTVSSYYRRSSGITSPDAIRLDFGPITCWFSYATLIAFQVGDHDRVVCENMRR